MLLNTEYIKTKHVLDFGYNFLQNTLVNTESNVDNLWILYLE